MEHLERLDRYLDEQDLAAVWFAEPASFAWLTGGGDSVVSERGPAGVAAAGYDGDGITVVTTNIEAERIATEEVPDGATVESFDWHAADLPEAVADVTPTPAASDLDWDGFASVDPSPLRQPLTDDQIAQYRSLGADTADAVESAVAVADPQMTERELAGAVKAELADRGIAGPVALVGGERRAQAYRHFTPKAETLDGFAHVSVVGVRDGLHASCTRSVAFDAPDWFGERTEAAARVASTALLATREVGLDGGTASDVFGYLQDAYAEQGWEGEWRNHHQGGAGGFDGREWVADPDNDAAVTLPMGYAWNPTVQGTKIEDTWLVTEDGFECLTEGDADRIDAPGVGVEGELAHAAPLVR